jgi:hypothetical protein
MGKSKTRTRKQRSETWKYVVHTKGSNRRSRSSKSSTRSYNDTWRSASPSGYKKDTYYTIGQLREFDKERHPNNQILNSGNEVEIKLKPGSMNPLHREYPVTGFFTSFTGDPSLFSIRHKDKYTGEDTKDTYALNHHLFRIIKVRDNRKKT